MTKKKVLQKKTDSTDNALDIAKKVLKTEAEAVYALIEKLNSNFEKAVEIIYKSKGRVTV